MRYIFLLCLIFLIFSTPLSAQPLALVDNNFIPLEEALQLQDFNAENAVLLMENTYGRVIINGCNVSADDLNFDKIQIRKNRLVVDANAPCIGVNSEITFYTQDFNTEPFLISSGIWHKNINITLDANQITFSAPLKQYSLSFAAIDCPQALSLTIPNNITFSIYTMQNYSFDANVDIFLDNNFLAEYDINSCLVKQNVYECNFMLNQQSQLEGIHTVSFVSSNLKCVSEILFNPISLEIISPSVGEYLFARERMDISFAISRPTEKPLYSLYANFWIEDQNNSLFLLAKSLDSICSDQDNNSATPNACLISLNLSSYAGLLAEDVNLVVELIDSNAGMLQKESFMFKFEDDAEISLIKPAEMELVTEGDYNISFYLIDKDDRIENINLEIIVAADNAERTLFLGNASSICQNTDSNYFCSFTAKMPEFKATNAKLKFIIEDSKAAYWKEVGNFILNYKLPEFSIISPKRDSHYFKLCRTEWKYKLKEETTYFNAELTLIQNNTQHKKILASIDLLNYENCKDNNGWRFCFYEWDCNEEGIFTIDFNLYIDGINQCYSSEKFYVNQPLINILKPEEGKYYFSSLPISFTVEDDENISQHSLQATLFNTQETIDLNISTADCNSSNCEKTVSINKRGLYNFCINITDSNITQNFCVENVLLNNSPPSLNILSPAANEIITLDHNILFELADNEDSNISIRATFNGNEIFNSKFSEICYDADGNISTINQCSYLWNSVTFNGRAPLCIEANDTTVTTKKCVDIIVDNVPPFIISLKPSHDTNSNIISFSAEDSSSGIDLNSISLAVGSITLGYKDLNCDGNINSLSCFAQPQLKEGFHKVVLEIKDLAGFSAKKHTEFIYDITAPEIFLDANNFVKISETDFNLCYSIKENFILESSYLVVDGNLSLNLDKNSGCIMLKNLTYTTHSICLYAVDSAKNTSKKCFALQVKKIIIEDTYQNISAENIASSVESITQKITSNLQHRVDLDQNNIRNIFNSVYKNIQSLSAMISSLERFSFPTQSYKEQLITIKKLASDINKALDANMLENILGEILALNSSISELASEMPKIKAYKRAKILYKASSSEISEIISKLSLTEVEKHNTLKLTNDANITKEISHFRVYYPNKGAEDRTLIKIKIILPYAQRNLILIDTLPFSNADIITPFKVFAESNTLHWILHLEAGEEKIISYSIPGTLDFNILPNIAPAILTKREHFLWFSQQKSNLLIMFSKPLILQFTIPEDSNISAFSLFLGAKDSANYPIKIQLFYEDLNNIVEEFYKQPSDLNLYEFALLKPLEVKQNKKLIIKLLPQKGDYWYIKAYKWYLANADDPWTLAELYSAEVPEQNAKYDAVFSFFKLKQFLKEEAPKPLANKPIPIPTEKPEKNANKNILIISLIIIALLTTIFIWLTLKKRRLRK